MRNYFNSELRFYSGNTLPSAIITNYALRIPHELLGVNIYYMQDFISIKTDINGSIPSVTVKQFDSNSRFLHVTLSDGDLPEDYNRIFEMTGCAARLLISLGHDRYEYVDGEVADPEGGIVTFPVPIPVRFALPSHPAARSSPQSPSPCGLRIPSAPTARFRRRRSIPRSKTPS